MLTTSPNDPCALSLAELAAATRDGRVSSEAVVRAYLDRVEEVNHALNAVVQLRREGAIAEARTADALPEDLRGPLHGVPVTIKDSFDTSGIVSTGGTLGRASFLPSADATVVARLRAAGAIVIGKTNTPDLTLALETHNLIYGRTNHPADGARTPGGSSGGAAAIIAAGACPLDLGSDTGGSIRVPAHFCGIAGIKPTTGRVPRTGHIIDYAGAAQSLTHIGPMARCVDDLALALSVMAGPDGVDPHIVDVPLRDHQSVVLAGRRVAYFLNLGVLRPTTETVLAVEESVRTLELAGCSVHPIEIPDADSIYEMYSGLFWSDGGASIRRLLARWGTTVSPLFDRITSAVTESSGDVLARFEQWDRWRSRMLTNFGMFDTIVCPAFPGPAPLHGGVSRPAAAYSQLFNLTGWPSTVIRAGWSPEGLPIGVQCVAQPWREDVSLAVARRLEPDRKP